MGVAVRDVARNRTEMEGEWADYLGSLKPNNTAMPSPGLREITDPYMDDTTPLSHLGQLASTRRVTRQTTVGRGVYRAACRRAQVSYSGFRTMPVPVTPLR